MNIPPDQHPFFDAHEEAMDLAVRAESRHAEGRSVEATTLYARAMPGVVDDEMRRRLIAEIEAIVARELFGLTGEELDYVMETFPIVKERDIKEFGEYHTKRLVLAAYDALAEAARTGHAHVSRFDPPPADPSVAHPSRVVQTTRAKVLPLRPARTVGALLQSRRISQKFDIASFAENLGISAQMLAVLEDCQDELTEANRPSLARELASKHGLTESVMLDVLEEALAQPVLIEHLAAREEKKEP